MRIVGFRQRVKGLTTAMFRPGRLCYGGLLVSGLGLLLIVDPPGMLHPLPIHTSALDGFGVGKALPTVIPQVLLPGLAGALAGEHRLKPANEAELRRAVSEAIQESFQEVPQHLRESRHRLSRHLQGHASGTTGLGVKYQGAALIVLAFEGTAEFEPRMAPVMQQAAQGLRAQGLNSLGSTMSLQYATFKGLRQFAGQEPNWSGLLTGPLESLLQDPLLQASTQWLSFPSEEFEALSRLTAVQKIPFDQLFHLAIGRRTGEAVGVENALLALQEIQQQAKALGKRPQFVLVSHSSGARSVIKFLERAASFQDSQGLPLHFPLVITIDPVCEAHRVMGEAFQELQKYWLKGLINRLLAWLNRLPWVEFEPSLSVAPQVRHRAQPDCLYAPANVGQFVSFYQQQDIEGLRMEPHFGIHGSPVQGAINLEIQAVGTRGHSEISYHPDVTRVFVAQLKAVLEAAEPSE